MKNFPIPIQKILPAILLGGALIGIFNGRHSSIAPVEASTARNPVVAPAGTVLRVWLNKPNKHSNLGPAGPEIGIAE